MIFSKHLFTPFVALILSGPLIDAQKSNDDVAAIQEVILEAYVNGIYNEGYMPSVNFSFDDSFESIGLTEYDSVKVETIAEWKTRVLVNKSQGKYPVADADQVSVKYLKIDIVGGELANVKLEFRVGGKLRSTDFIDLYKFKGGWKLVNRTYYQPDGE